MLQFARCMRDHGVDVPDPDDGQRDRRRHAASRPRRSTPPSPRARSGSRWPSREDGGEPLTEEQKQSFLDQAQCMRDRGWNVSDPVFDGGRVSSSSGRTQPAAPGDPEPGDPRFEKDLKECADEAGMEPPDRTTDSTDEERVTDGRPGPSRPSRSGRRVLAACGRPRRPAADAVALVRAGPPRRSSAPTSLDHDDQRRARSRRDTPLGGTHRRGRSPGSPPVGSTVADGQPLYAVDTRPVVRLTGAVPAWRDLGPSSPTAPTCCQLEQALPTSATPRPRPDGRRRLDLGDDHRGRAVAEGPRRARRPAPCGSATSSSRPRDVRVAEQLADLGALVEPGAPVLGVSATQQVVTSRCARPRPRSRPWARRRA